MSPDILLSGCRKLGEDPPKWAGTVGEFQYNVVLSLAHVVTPCVYAGPTQTLVAAAPGGSAGVSTRSKLPKCLF